VSSRNRRPRGSSIARTGVFERSCQAGSIDCECGACGGAKERAFVVTKEGQTAVPADRRWLIGGRRTCHQGVEARSGGVDLVSGASILGNGNGCLSDSERSVRGF